MDTSKYLRKLIIGVRTVAAYGIFVWLSNMIGMSFMLGTRYFRMSEALTDFVSGLIMAVIEILAFCSISKTFAVNDVSFRKQYFSGNNEDLKFFQKLKFVVCSPDFLLVAVVYGFLSFLLPINFSFLDFKNVYLPRIFWRFSTLIIFAILNLFSYILSINSWIVEERNSNIHK